jgi:hypothetical protein
LIQTRTSQVWTRLVIRLVRNRLRSTPLNLCQRKVEQVLDSRRRRKLLVVAPTVPTVVALLVLVLQICHRKVELVLEPHSRRRGTAHGTNLDQWGRSRAVRHRKVELVLDPHSRRRLSLSQWNASQDGKTICRRPKDRA